jgi:hypothetical protein
LTATWPAQRDWALDILQPETSLLEIVQLLGADTLPAQQQVVLRTGQLLREDFLQQSSFDQTDAYCPLAKQQAMLSIIMAAHHAMSAAVSHGGGGRTRLRRGHPGTPGTHRRHAVRNQGHATPVGHPGGSDGVSSAGGPAFTGLRRCWCRLPSGGTRLASISMPSPRRAHPGCTAAGFHE